jgi:hypothetical protein
MAGEWIPIDCNLGTKPEVLELVDVTGEPVEAVVYRLIQLWSWASMNTADGSIRCTPARLRAVAGGDETFWLAVEQVGWVSFDGGHMTITGWDKRFSKSAKARLHDNRRKLLEREKNCDVRVLSEKCPEKTGPEERRGEEKREELKPAAQVPTSEPQKRTRSTATASISWNSSEGWQGITDADHGEWRDAYPAADIGQELAKATAWLKANPTRAKRKNWRKFVVAWLSRCQDSGGSRRERGNRLDEKPPPERWMDKYQPTGYRRPREVAAVAASLKLHEEDL